MIRYKKISHRIKPLFPKLKKELEKDKSIAFSYVFGSYGRKGRVGPLSDVDVAVYLSEDRKINFWEKKLELIGIINEVLKTDEVDLVILNEAPLPFQYEVIRTGKLLFSKNEGKRVKFVVRVIDSYSDTERLRVLQWRNLLYRIENGYFGK